jgi:hypothetical protein
MVAELPRRILMNINKRPWPLATVCGPIRERIDTRPDYQRPLVWSHVQKQLLIDTILRGYDVPKLYWRRIGKKPDRYEVVDGQQRLHAVWDFYDGKYALALDADPANGYKIAGLHYPELPDELRIQFDTYPLDMIVLEETDEEEAREMFLRLQSGSTLKASEKRNAMAGNVRDMVRELTHHEFFSRCGFANRRFEFDQVVAQMLLLELAHGPCEIGDQELTKAYSEYSDFDFARGQGKKIADKIRRVLVFLSRAFPEKTPELKKTSAVSLYLLVSTLMDTHVIANLEPSFGEWFIDFETTRTEDEGRPQDERDPDMVSYHEHTTRATNSEDSIKLRHEILSRTFMLAFTDLPRLDNKQREFSFEQKLAIYRKYRGICQWVEKDGMHCGVKCSWSDWHADHIIPWSRGGPTTVANGQLLCPKHNLIKGATLPNQNSVAQTEGNSPTGDWTPLSTPESVQAPIQGSKYSSVLNKLCDLGWKPEQLPGQGRTAYALDSSGKTLAILRHALKQKKGRSDFYFFGLSRTLFQKWHSQGCVYVFLQCGTPSSVLVIPGDYLHDCFHDVPTSGETEDWKVNVFTDGETWTWQPSGKARLELTTYLNYYPRPSRKNP